MNAITKTAEPQATEIDIFGAANVFDVARFEQVHRVATVMAGASLIPDHLKGANREVTYGNCFMISNLAANWGLDPFAVAQASALVFGKIVLEGKLVRAVIKKFLGFDLNYVWFGPTGNMDRRCYVSDRPLVVDNEELDTHGQPLNEAQIESLMKLPEWRITKGTLGKWHTKNKQGGINDNWAKDEDKMFRERGAREWCREFSPGLMLGVYTPDEFDDVEHTSRSNRARDVTPGPARNPLLEEVMDPDTGEFTKIAEKTTTQSGAQPGGTALKTTAEPKADKAQASAQPAEESAGNQRDGQTNNGGRPAETPSSAAPGVEDGSGGDAGNSPAARVSADVFREYHSALGRMVSKESVEKAHKQFWSGKGIKVAHDDDMKLAKDIYENHLQRADGKIPGDVLAKEIAGWIAQVTGEQL